MRPTSKREKKKDCSNHRRAASTPLGLISRSEVSQKMKMEIVVIME